METETKQAHQTETDEEYILFLVKEINESFEKPENKNKSLSHRYRIHNYNLEDMILSVEIDKISVAHLSNATDELLNIFNKVIFRTTIRAYDYSSVTEFTNFGGTNTLFNNTCDTLEDAVRLIFSLRNKYKYSRLTDNFEEKEKVNYIEKKVLVFNRLCDYEPIDICCVCYEPNILLTARCKHCLCRLCFNKINYEVENDDEEYKLCPVCRGFI